MDEENKAGYGQLFSLLSKKSLKVGEAKLVFAMLQAVEVDGYEGIEYSLFNFRLLTGMLNRDVDVNLASLLTKKLFRLYKAKNGIVFVNFAHKVRHYKQLNSNNSKTVKHVTVDAKSAKSDHPLAPLMGNIKLQMPHVSYDGKTLVIEQASIKRLYKKFYLAFPWSNSEYQAVGLLKDYLAYKLDSDEWFRTQANLPFTYLAKHADSYIAGIKPKLRDDRVNEQVSGRRLRWDVRSQTWCMILKKEEE